MDEKLRDKIAEVVRLRQARQAIADVVQQSRAKWETENASLLSDLEKIRQATFVGEEELRTWAVALYRETGSKQPGPGLGIRVVRSLVYPADAAVAWAAAHEMCQFLRLDKAAFEKVAPDLGLDFVTVSEVPTVTLAADLDKALKEAGDGNTV